METRNLQFLSPSSHPLGAYEVNQMGYSMFLCKTLVMTLPNFDDHYLFTIYDGNFRGSYNGTKPYKLV